MAVERRADQVVIELHRNGVSSWRARVASLSLDLQRTTPAEAVAAVFVALIEADRGTASDLQVRTSYSTRVWEAEVSLPAIAERSGPKRYP